MNVTWKPGLNKNVPEDCVYYAVYNLCVEKEVSKKKRKK